MGAATNESELSPTYAARGLRLGLGFSFRRFSLKGRIRIPMEFFENFRLPPLPFVTPDVTLHRETVSAILVELRGSTL